MRIVVLVHLDVRQQLDADIGREDHRHEPGCDQRDRHDPEDAAGIFATAVDFVSALSLFLSTLRDFKWT